MILFKISSVCCVFLSVLMVFKIIFLSRVWGCLSVIWRIYWECILKAKASRKSSAVPSDLCFILLSPFDPLFWPSDLHFIRDLWINWTHLVNQFNVNWLANLISSSESVMTGEVLLITPHFFSILSSNLALWFSFFLPSSSTFQDFVILLAPSWNSRLIFLF